jgi:WD40 repeat protein
LISAAHDSTVRIWSAATGEPLREIAIEAERPEVRGIAVSPDGKLLAWSGWEGNARLYELEAGAEIPLIEPPESSTSSIAFSPDGRRIAFGFTYGVGTPREGDTTLVGLWDARTGERLRSLKGPAATIVENPVRFVLEGRRVIFLAQWEKEARLWDADDGTLRFKFAAERDSFGGWAIAEDGRHLATLANVVNATDAGGTESGNAIVFRDLETGEVTRRVPVSGDAANRLLLTPDGRRAVTFTRSRTRLIVFELDGGAEIGSIENDRFDLRLPAAIAPDGRSLALGLADGTILVYELPPIP